MVKDAPADELLVAIRGVLQGDAIVSPSVTRRLLDRFLFGPPDTCPLDELTGRERDVLVLIGSGLINGEPGCRACNVPHRYFGTSVLHAGTCDRPARHSDRTATPS